MRVPRQVDRGIPDSWVMPTVVNMDEWSDSASRQPGVSTLRVADHATRARRGGVGVAGTRDSRIRGTCHSIRTVFLPLTSSRPSDVFKSDFIRE
jgi:hypothetical protein